MIDKKGPPRHWHITRDIKPRGECAACDLSWAVMDKAEQSKREHPAGRGRA
jgi:hypothetical protein